MKLKNLIRLLERCNQESEVDLEFPSVYWKTQVNYDVVKATFRDTRLETLVNRFETAVRLEAKQQICPHRHSSLAQSASGNDS